VVVLGRIFKIDQYRSNKRERGRKMEKEMLDKIRKQVEDYPVLIKAIEHAVTNKSSPEVLANLAVCALTMLRRINNVFVEEAKRCN